MCVCSSGDSTGVKPDDQKARYDEVVKRRPDTILSLEHEVYGMFIFYFFPLFNMNVFAECTFYVFFFQNPACKSLLFNFCCCSIRRKMFFYRHEVLPYAIEKLQKAGYKLVTVAECLGEQPYHTWGHPTARDVCQIFSFFTGVFLTYLGG